MQPGLLRNQKCPPVGGHGGHNCSKSDGKGGESGAAGAAARAPVGGGAKATCPPNRSQAATEQAHVRAVRGTSDLDPWRVAGSMKGAERDRRARLSQNLLSQNGYATLICFFLRTVGYFY